MRQNGPEVRFNSVGTPGFFPAPETKSGNKARDSRNLLPRMSERMSFVYSRGGTRTPDPVINSHLLYQLSYSGKRNNCNDLPNCDQPQVIRKLS
jgi:hypothetical protein